MVSNPYSNLHGAKLDVKPVFFIIYLQKSLQAVTVNRVLVIMQSLRL